MKKHLVSIFILTFSAFPLFAHDACSESPLLQKRSIKVAKAICKKLRAGEYGEHLDGQTVTAENLASIKKLSLERAGISELRSKDFAGLTALKHLNLGKNELTTLPEDIFNELTELEYLGLFDNQLAELPAGLFAGLTKLEKLSLRDNKLKTFPQGIFAGLPALRRLDLGENPFIILPQEAFGDTLPEDADSIVGGMVWIEGWWKRW